MPPPAQLQTSRAAQASPLLAQTILLFVTPAFSGLLTSRLSGILLSNIETRSGLPRLKKRTGSPFDPMSPPAAASHSRYTSSRELLVRLSPFLPLMYLPVHQSLASALRPPLRRPCQVAGFFQDAKRSAPPWLRSAPALQPSEHSWLLPPLFSVPCVAPPSPASLRTPGTPPARSALRPVPCSHRLPLFPLPLSSSPRLG